MANFPTSNSTDANLYIAKNNLSASLSGAHDAAVTTVTVISTTGFPTTGYITIDSEAISYTGTTATTFTGCIRGADGTTAASHVTLSQVLHTVVAAHHNLLKNEVIAIEEDLTTRIGSNVGLNNIKAIDGSFAAPAYTFAAHSASGIYTDANGDVNIGVANGLAKFSFWAGGLDPANADNTLGLGALDTDAQGAIGWKYLALGPGSAAIPSVHFSQDRNTGIYSPTADTLAINTGGTARITANNTDITLVGVVTASGQLIGKGTATNDSPASGYIGEVLEATLTSLTNFVGTTTQYMDVTSVALTAGDWMITGAIDYNLNGATVTSCEGGIGTSAGNTSSGLTAGDTDFFCLPPTAGTNTSIAIPAKRVSIAAGSTRYLKASISFSAGTPRVRGRITAWRIR